MQAENHSVPFNPLSFRGRKIETEREWKALYKWIYASSLIHPISSLRLLLFFLWIREQAKWKGGRRFFSLFSLKLSFSLSVSLHACIIFPPVCRLLLLHIYNLLEPSEWEFPCHRSFLWIFMQCTGPRIWDWGACRKLWLLQHHTHKIIYFSHLLIFTLLAVNLNSFCECWLHLRGQKVGKVNLIFPFYVKRKNLALNIASMWFIYICQRK